MVLISSVEDLRGKNKDVVMKVMSVLRGNIDGGSLYLFGSYAKGKVKPTSDIDLLILLEGDKDRETIKDIRRKTTDIAEEGIEYCYEIDIKVYNSKDFFDSSKRLGFESEIEKYMIKLI